MALEKPRRDFSCDLTFCFSRSRVRSGSGQRAKLAVFNPRGAGGSLGRYLLVGAYIPNQHAQRYTRGALERARRDEPRALLNLNRGDVSGQGQVKCEIQRSYVWNWGSHDRSISDLGSNCGPSIHKRIKQTYPKRINKRIFTNVSQGYLTYLLSTA